MTDTPTTEDRGEYAVQVSLDLAVLAWDGNTARAIRIVHQALGELQVRLMQAGVKDAAVMSTYKKGAPTFDDDGRPVWSDE